MKKNEQIAINEEVLRAIGKFNSTQKTGQIRTERLRTCSAHVIHYNEYTVLVSYTTVVAFIDNESGDLYDILRAVYGYTSTSAQHIAKFKHDYYHYNEYTFRAL